ncbi:MAG: SPOR domain-containing protein, partial [Methylocystis sp.]|nr:SPOR domain-containing protein [Methylocystis sp.]
AGAARSSAQKEEAPQEPTPREPARHDAARAAGAPLVPAESRPVAPAFLPLPERLEKARPAFIPGGQRRAEQPAERKSRFFSISGRISAADGSTSRAGGRRARAPTGATPSAVRRANGGDVDRTVVSKIGKSDNGADARPARAGWMIQIGASETVDKANQLLALARSQAHGVPASATAFTEKVQKGKETLYRARFAGLEAKSAESACRTLKRSGFACFAIRN